MFHPFLKMYLIKFIYKEIEKSIQLNLYIKKIIYKENINLNIIISQIFYKIYDIWI
jgi:hypothetical protein